MATGLSTGAGAAGVAAGGLAGAIPDNSSTKSQSTGSQVQTGNTSSNLSSQLQNYLNSIYNLSSAGRTTGTGTVSATPNLTPQMQAYINSLIGRGSNLQAPSLTGYAAGQTQNINANSNLQSQAVQNLMAARGLSTSPVAATTQAGIEQNRVNQITQMQENLPVMQNQMNLQNLAQSANIAGMFPGLAGTTQQQQTAQDTSQTQTGTQQQTQDQYAQSWQNIFNFMQGFQNNWGSQQTTSGGGLGGALQGGAEAFLAILPLLAGFSDKKLKKNIQEIPQNVAMEKIRQLRSRTWKWKETDTESAGVIAQELEKIIPDLVDDTKLGDMPVKMVNYSGLIPYLVGAVQNLDSRVGG